MADRCTDWAQLLDRDKAVALFRTMIGCESITGNEAKFVALLQDEMSARFLSPVQEDFLPGRPNIYGKRAGTGDGNNLLFIGHTDTVHVDGWTAQWEGQPQMDPFGGALIDGEIWGRGSGDLKAGICASLLALDLIDKAGVKLNGDVSFAFVGDEESGRQGSGISAGIDHLTRSAAFRKHHHPDFAIYVEPTQLQVFPAQMGFFIADIRIIGKSAYFGVPEQGVDALKATHSVLAGIWDLSEKCAGAETHNLVGKAFLLVTGINGGGYIAVPGECTISLIAKILPNGSLDDTANALEQVIRKRLIGTGCTYEVTYPAGRDHQLGGTPSDIDGTTDAIALLRSALNSGKGLAGALAGAPYWSEAPFLIDRLNCPTVYCAPGNIANCHTLEERVELGEFYAGITAFADFIARYCGTENS